MYKLSPLISTDKTHSSIMSIFFGIKHVELSKAFVYLTNIPKGVVVSTILLNKMPAPVLNIVLVSISFSFSGNIPYSPDNLPDLQIIFIGPQFA